MHDDGLRLRARERPLGDLVAGGVLGQRRQQARRHAFVLQAQRHHGVGPVERVLEAMRDPNARQARERGRHQRRRAAQDDLGAELGEQFDVRARHPGVLDVPHDGQALPLEPA